MTFVPFAACSQRIYASRVTQQPPPYQPPQYPPPQYPPPHAPTPLKRPWWKALWFVALIATLVGVAIGAGSASASKKTKSEPGPTVTATATVAVTSTATVTRTERPTVVRTIATRTHTLTVRVHPHYNSFGEGLYVVGREISPGLYHTSGASDCYWARLSSLDTTDIIDNGDNGGPQTIEVQSSDRALEIEGSCTFGRA